MTVVAYEQLSYTIFSISFDCLLASKNSSNNIQDPRPHVVRILITLIFLLVYSSVAYPVACSRSSNPKDGFVLGPPHEYQTQNMIRSQQYAYSVDKYNAVLLSKQRRDLDRGQSRFHYLVAWSDDWSRMSGGEKGKQGIGVHKLFGTL